MTIQQGGGTSANNLSPKEEAARSAVLSREEFATQLHRVIDSAQLDVEEGQLLGHYDALCTQAETDRLCIQRQADELDKLRAQLAQVTAKLQQLQEDKPLSGVIDKLEQQLAAVTAERDAYQLASAEHWTESFNPDDENNVVPKVTWYRATCAILQAELNEARKLISDWETPDECRALLQQQLAQVTAENKRLQQKIASQRRVLSVKYLGVTETKLHLLREIERWRAKASGEVPTFGHGAKHDFIAHLQQQLAEAHNEERRAKDLLCRQVTHATTLQARITELEAALNRILAFAPAHSDKVQCIQRLNAIEDTCKAALKANG